MSVPGDTDAEIDGLYREWATAFYRNSVDSVLDLLTADYVVWYAGAEPITKSDLAARLAAAFSAYEIAPSFEREERLVSGDLAFERGWDVQQIRARSSGEIMTRRERVLLVLRRASDGKWRFARAMSQPARPPNGVDNANCE